jgi:hypothetical protein
MLREKLMWRTHEDESAERYLNLEKHQDAGGFSVKRW